MRSSCDPLSSLRTRGFETLAKLREKTDGSRRATGRVSDAAAASTERPEWSARGSVSVPAGDDAEGALGSGVGEERGVRGVPPYGRAREGGEVEGTARASGGAGHGAKDAHALAHPREACERAAGTIAGTSAGTVGSVESVGFAGRRRSTVRLEVGGGDLEGSRHASACGSSGSRSGWTSSSARCSGRGARGCSRARSGRCAGSRGWDEASLAKLFALDSLRALHHSSSSSSSSRRATTSSPSRAALSAGRDAVSAPASASASASRDPDPDPDARAPSLPLRGSPTLPRGVASRVPPLRARARGEVRDGARHRRRARARTCLPPRYARTHRRARRIETARADQHHDTPALGTSNTRPSDQRLGRAERADDR